MSSLLQCTKCDLFFLFSTPAWTFAARVPKFTGHFGWGMILLFSLDIFDNNSSLGFQRKITDLQNIFFSCLLPPHQTPSLFKKRRLSDNNLCKSWHLKQLFVINTFSLSMPLSLKHHCWHHFKKWTCIWFPQQTKERYKQGSGGVTELTKSLSQVCLVWIE